MTDAWEQIDRGRRIFCFLLEPEHDDRSPRAPAAPTRSIPSRVRAQVYRRDRGRCVICRSTRDLHFDHIIPFSKGGSSTTTKNIQLLCARHNLKKSNTLQ